MDRGYALLYAEEHKNIVHLEGYRRAGVLFQPLAVETLGGWSPHAISAIRTIGSHLGSRWGLAPAEVSQHLFLRLSVCLWHANAHMWLSRSPSIPPSVDGCVTLSLCPFSLFCYSVLSFLCLVLNVHMCSPRALLSTSSSLLSFSFPVIFLS